MGSRGIAGLLEEPMSGGRRVVAVAVAVAVALVAVAVALVAVAVGRLVLVESPLLEQPPRVRALQRGPHAVALDEQLYLIVRGGLHVLRELVNLRLNLCLRRHGSVLPLVYRAG